MENEEIVSKDCFMYRGEDEDLEKDIEDYLESDGNNIVIHHKGTVYCEKRSRVIAESIKLEFDFGTYFLLNDNYLHDNDVSFSDITNRIIISENAYTRKLLNYRFCIFDSVYTNMDIENYKLYDFVSYTLDNFKNALEEEQEEQEEEYGEELMEEFENLPTEETKEEEEEEEEETF